MKSLDQISNALESSEFFLVYQPTILLEDNSCVGAEALIRWNHNGELISPEEFIPIIENTPISESLTYWVMGEIARELGGWLKKTDQVHIGINIPPEIIGRRNLTEASKKTGLFELADKLVMEITERGFPDEAGLEALRFKGGTNVKIALDDFGTGDANLLQLSKINADIIKIDKFFIDQIQEGEEIPEIVIGLAAFARSMNKELIAEGVETSFQAEVLKNLGIQMAQGWFYSKPLRVNDFMRFYSDNRESS